jgi:hypothetical protein
MSKIISIYINGTDEPANFDKLPNFPEDYSYPPITSLANILHEMTKQDKDNISICLNGCGINNPYLRDLGAIFTWNLQRQIDEMVTLIKAKLTNDKLVLNVYGFSRGGAGAYWLAKKLSDVDPEQLEINVLAFEPVPGNFINGVYVDKLLGTDLTLSGQIADLRDCKNLKRVYSLFTNIPLPDIVCHGPILPALPVGCEHSVDVVPGCHKGAELFKVAYNSLTEKKYIEPYNADCAIAFQQVVSFLRGCGTKFVLNKFDLAKELLDKGLIELIYAAKVDELQTNTTRAMHFTNAIYAKPAPDRIFLNQFHQQLAKTKPDANTCILTVQDADPTPSLGNGQASAARYIYPILLFSVATYVMTQRAANTSNSFKFKLS